MDGVHIVVLLILVCIDVADVISDWLLYTDVSLTEKGLVCGPPDIHAVQALLVFTCLGSILLFFELLNVVYEFSMNFKRSPCVDVDIVSIFSVWLVDVTQVIISMSLALNSEEVSGFQVSKAIVVLMSVIVRLAISCIKSESHKSHRHNCIIKSGIVAAGVIEVVCASVIFALYNSEHGAAGGPVIGVNGTYSDNAHFNRIGVFVNIPEYFDAGHIDSGKQDAVVNWAQLTSVTRIRASSGEPVMFSVQLETNGTDTLKMAVRKKDGQTWLPPTCYGIQTTTGSVSPESADICGSKGYFGNGSVEAFVKFKFEPPGNFFKRRIFGQIYYNVKILANGVCLGTDRYLDAARLAAKIPVTLVLHYYRAERGVGGYFAEGQGGLRFFRNDPDDMTDVAEVWTSGKLNRKTTGSVSPELDTGMDVDCSRT